MESNALCKFPFNYLATRIRTSSEHSKTKCISTVSGPILIGCFEKLSFIPQFCPMPSHLIFLNLGNFGFNSIRRPVS